jgi:hypothetical protein
MRRTPICAVVLALGSLALPGLAAAAPKVAFKLTALPIPGFAHTGNHLGAGAYAKLDFTIEGTEYFGSPPPIIGARFYAPAGAVVHPAGFPTCPEETLLEVGPGACPTNSKAGPVGTLLGSVTFGGDRVYESGELLPFLRPGGGFYYFAAGHTPTVIEAIAKGRFSHLGGIDGYGFEEEEELPLIATVPEGPYASVDTITGAFGAAIRSHGKTLYLFRLPRTCPQGGFPLKAEAVFAEDGEPSRPETVTAFDRAPCPRRQSGSA